MTDLGFGLVDRRTIIAVLVTLVLCNLLFGFAFPLNTTNVLDLFLDLAFFTGYLYVTRTVFRLPIAISLAFKSAWKRRQYYSYAIQYRGSIKEWWTRLKKILPEYFLAELLDQKIWRGLLGFLDRLVLLGITVLATIPNYGIVTVRTIGAIGLGCMLVVYLFGGSFTFMLKDALQKAEEDKERLIEKAGTQPNFPSRIETYTRGPDPW